MLHIQSPPGRKDIPYRSDYLLLSFLSRDPKWEQISLSPSEIDRYTYAIAFAALPKRFTVRGLREAPESNPYLFQLVKSKCWGSMAAKVLATSQERWLTRVFAEHICEKAGHSCIRRVCSHFNAPFKRAWRLLSRGLQALPMLLHAGVEVYNLCDAATEAYASVGKLGRFGQRDFCHCCGQGKQSMVTVCVDIDQAFEMVSGQLVVSAFRHFAKQYFEAFGTATVRVRRTKRVHVAAGDRGASSVYSFFTLQELWEGLCGFLSCSMATYLGTSWRLSGVTIGGLCSKTSLTLGLCFLEQAYKEGFTRALTADTAGILGGASTNLDTYIGLRRYVDDGLAVSSSLCSSCIQVSLRTMYGSLPLSFPFGDTSFVESVEWLDIVVKSGSSISLHPKYHNAAYAEFRTDVRERATYMPFMGGLPMSWNSIKAILLGKLARMVQIKASEDDVVQMLNFEFAELLRLQYPLDTVRSIMHALPSTIAGASRAKRAFRKTAKTLAQ